MKEIAFVINNITPRSLLIIDELGRGTSNMEGMAIAWAVAEYLLSLPAYTMMGRTALSVTQQRLTTED